jgi:hypothetical protein
MKGRGIGRGSRCRQQEELRKNWRLECAESSALLSGLELDHELWNRNTLDRKLDREMT